MKVGVVAYSSEPSRFAWASCAIAFAASPLDVLDDHRLVHDVRELRRHRPQEYVAAAARARMGDERDDGGPVRVGAGAEGFRYQKNGQDTVRGSWHVRRVY